MQLSKIKPTTAGTRHKTVNTNKGLAAVRPLKSLRRIGKKFSGRNNSGKITVRHRGGQQKRFIRLVDFKRKAMDLPAKVVTIEYDPNRSANIALVNYLNGSKAYILAPEGLIVGQTVIATRDNADIQPGNCMPLSRIPVGTPIHNIELTPGKGGQIVRSAGTAALIQSKEDKWASIKLPSGEIRLVRTECLATIGQVSNPEHKNRKIGKAGTRRHMGWRPTVRGVAQHPNSHPHGGGEGRSGIGMKSPKTPWGKKALGKKTRNKRKHSTQYIIKNTKSKK